MGRAPFRSRALVVVMAAALSVAMTSTGGTTTWSTDALATATAAAASSSSVPAAPNKKKRVVVVVSGAGGQTGRHLLRMLLDLPGGDNNNDDDDDDDEYFFPVGLVRTEASKKELVDSWGVPDAHVSVCDVTVGGADAVRAAIVATTAGGVVDDGGDNNNNNIFAFCIATSAKPAPNGLTDAETGRPLFGYPDGDPEVVDWVGQRNQIDACPPGCHVVICGTMGGTAFDHPLNRLGRTVREEDGTEEVGGNIVRWKRKAEMYLIGRADLKYTIIHAGGLLNEPGGERELVVGVDDDLSSYGNTDSRTVPRQDVARVMLEAVLHPDVYAQRSFDLRAKPVGEGTVVTTDFTRLLDPLGGANCDYTLGGAGGATM